MSSPSFFVGSFLALLLTSTALAAACGDGGAEALTLEEYFQRLDANANDNEARYDAPELQPAFDPEASEEERLNSAALNAREQPDILADAVSALEDVDPPAEAEDAHEEFLAVLRDFQPVIEEAAGRIGDAQSGDELDAAIQAELYENPELIALEERLIDACLALQGLADDNNIAVDLTCEEDGE